MKLFPTLWLGSPANEDSGTGAMAVYKYSLKNLPYTDIIIMNDNTVMNSPPISVTAQRGMLSKKPQSSTAVTISCGSTVFCAEPKPAAFMIAEITPCTILNRAIISSKP